MRDLADVAEALRDLADVAEAMRDLAEVLFVLALVLPASTVPRERLRLLDRDSVLNETVFLLRGTAASCTIACTSAGKYRPWCLPRCTIGAGVRGGA